MAKIGRNQRESRKAKIERLVGRVVKTTFVVEGSELRVTLKDKLKIDDGQPLGRYFLQNYSIPIHLKNVRFNEYEQNLTVNVQKGSYVEKQLIKAGVLE